MREYVISLFRADLAVIGELLYSVFSIAICNSVSFIL